MWKLDQRELTARLEGGGGEHLTRFMDALLRGEARSGGVAEQVHTQVRTNIGDGGVDSQVDCAVPGDRSGWLGMPTCWQYKAQLENAITRGVIAKELGKTYVRDLIKKGYGYRLAIRGDVTAERLKEIEGWLLTEVRAINAAAPEPHLLAIDKIADWAGRFPGVVLQVHGFVPEASIWSFEEYMRRLSAVTPQYVVVPNWAAQQAQVSTHCDTHLPVADACMSLRGEAGVGKSRLAMEALRAIAGAPEITVCTEGEQAAVAVARSLTRETNVTAILVADECPLGARMEIDSLLRPISDRVRVISIDNSPEAAAGAAPDVLLKRMPDSVLDQVLARNWPDVPPEHRRAISDVSGGFIRFAADMCRNYRSGATDVLGGAGSVENYLVRRLGDDLVALEVLSLVPKLGWKDEVATELREIVGVCGRDEAAIRESVSRLRDAPGFVAVAGRYWYVTPAIVARIAFARAWKKWIADKFEAVLGSLSAPLAERFIERAKEYGGTEVRETISRRFRDWISGLTPEALVDPLVAKQAAVIVETEPNVLLPILSGTLVRGSPDVLRAISGQWTGTTWGARRSLVWLLERLAPFPEYFEFVEAGLWVLATNESEQGIGNNATSIWKQLFRVQLSGTATSLETRMQLLGRRLADLDPAHRQLVVSALDHSIDPMPSRMVGPSVVSGRVPPADWHPKTYGELRAGYDAILRLLSGAASDENRAVRDDAVRSMLRHTFRLLDAFETSRVRDAFDAARLSEDEWGSLRREVSRYIEWNEETPTTEDEAVRHFAAVRAWYESMRPTELRGRILDVLSRDPWDEELRTKDGRVGGAVMDIAREALASPAAMNELLECTNAHARPVSAVFGAALAELGGSPDTATAVVDAAIATGSGDLLRGLVPAAARVNGAMLEGVWRRLDALAERQPSIAFDVIVAGGDALGGSDRIFSLVDNGSVPVARLEALSYGIGTRRPTLGELRAVLKRLTEAAELRKDIAALRSGLLLVTAHLDMHEGTDFPAVLDDAECRMLAWRIASVVPAQRDTSYDYHWEKLIERIYTDDPRRACALAATQLLNRRAYGREEASKALVHIAKTHPLEVMSAFGDALMDKEQGLMLQFDDCKDLVAALPPHVVIEWIERNAVEGSRAIAHHVPSPFVSGDGKPVVPEVTARLLATFGDDKTTFSRFVTGVHGIEVWRGDPSAKLRQRAADARRFLSHPIDAVRRWAVAEAANCERLADHEQREHEERFL